MTVSHTLDHRLAQLLVATLGLASMFVLTRNASAQPSLTLSFGRMLDSYAQPSADRDTRQTTAGSIAAEHLFADQRASLFYSLDGGDYATAGDWFCLLHGAGFSYRVGGAEASSRKVFLTGSGSWRENGASWSEANYRSFGAGVNAELHPRLGGTARFGYRANRRSFPDLGLLDQTEQKAFGSLLHNFPTRTTVIAEAQVRGKWYDGETVVQWAGMPSSATTTGTTMHGGRGSGMSRGVQGGVYISVFEGTGSAGQASVLGRVAFLEESRS